MVPCHNYWKLLKIIEVAPKSPIISCPVGRIEEVGLLE